jgi:hypothetical protein
VAGAHRPFRALRDRDHQPGYRSRKSINLKIHDRPRFATDDPACTHCRNCTLHLAMFRVAHEYVCTSVSLSLFVCVCVCVCLANPACGYVRASRASAADWCIYTTVSTRALQSPIHTYVQCRHPILQQYVSFPCAVLQYHPQLHPKLFRRIYRGTPHSFVAAATLHLGVVSLLPQPPLSTKQLASVQSGVANSRPWHTDTHHACKRTGIHMWVP